MSCNATAQFCVVSKNFFCGVNWIFDSPMTVSKVSRYPNWSAATRLNVVSNTDFRTGSAYVPPSTALFIDSLPVAHWMHNHAGNLLRELALIAHLHVHRLVL